jgi:FAD:protein FMN transferase
MEEVRVACSAMATRFELVLLGDDPHRLRAAGEEALAEILRIEALLSMYRPNSEIGRINAEAATRPVRVHPEVMELLRLAGAISERTGGAFDVTVGPLMVCWKLAGGGGAVPEPRALEAARARVGYTHLELDAAGSTVRFARPGLVLDLGAIGKGYAIDRAAELLLELGVENALLHGGTSTVRGIGRAGDAPGWTVAVRRPGPARDPAGHRAGTTPRHDPDRPAAEEHDGIVALVELHDTALSVSAVAGKSFVQDGVEYGHVLDPRTGWPVRGATLAAVVCPSATEADALSTALLTLASDERESIRGDGPAIDYLVLGAPPAGDPPPLEGRGDSIRVLRRH